MNTPLIPVTPGQLDGHSTQLVDARLLYAFLEVGKDFSNWIKGRIEQYEFVINEDYLLAKTGEQLSSGTKWRLDYYLSLDMAKELAMVERNPRGKQARRYFIACEKQLRQLQQVADHRTAKPTYSINLSRAQRQAINRQAWADVAGHIYAEFHARREALLRQAQTHVRIQATAQRVNDIVRQHQDFRPKWAR